MTNSQDIVTLQNELLQHVPYNNPLFQCYATNAFFPSNNNYYITEHWHDDLEFIYINNGQLEFSVNGNTFILNENEGVLVNSKRIHSNHTIDNKSCGFYCAIMHPDLVCSNKYIEQKFLKPLSSLNSFDYLILRKDDWTKDIIDELTNLFEKANPKTIELEILEASYRICRILFNNMEFVETPNIQTDHYITNFKSMILFIQDNYMNKISLDAISYAGNVGKTLCAKIFKKYTSKTPGDYLIYYRIQKSIELLTTTSLSTTEISFSTGFSSASHFTKTFRTLMGYTPLQYRNNPRNNFEEYCLIPEKK